MMLVSEFGGLMMLAEWFW